MPQFGQLQKLIIPNKLPDSSRLPMACKDRSTPRILTEGGHRQRWIESNALKTPSSIAEHGNRSVYMND